MPRFLDDVGVATTVCGCTRGCMPVRARIMELSGLSPVAGVAGLLSLDDATGLGERDREWECDEPM